MICLWTSDDGPLKIWQPHSHCQQLIIFPSAPGGRIKRSKYKLVWASKENRIKKTQTQTKAATQCCVCSCVQHLTNTLERDQSQREHNFTPSLLRRRIQTHTDERDMGVCYEYIFLSACFESCVCDVSSSTAESLMRLRAAKQVIRGFKKVVILI